MKILLAPDSFKGTMSSLEVINYIERVAKNHFINPDIVKVPIADGGEGTVEALVSASSGEYRTVAVTDPLGRKINATYGIVNGDTAIIEMAQASGLPLLKEVERNPLLATSYGTGEIIKAVLDAGIRNLIIGLGGSATNDGGIGAMQALGISFSDLEGNEVGFGGKFLSKISSVDTKNMHPGIKDCNITVICDVSNPLTGPKGATHIFGAQKGADEKTLDLLESGMKNYSKIMSDYLGIDIESIPGAGAAGGLGAALVGFLGAALKPGIETVLDFVGFDKLLEGVDIVITGEGRIDGQSVFGKVPVGIARRCSGRKIPVVAIVGSMGQDAQKVYDYGISSIIPVINAAMPLEEALSRSRELMEDAADRLFRLLKVGMDIKVGQ